ncbi:unnamed protein product [Cylindrotheca closterium]|uniref:SBF1/SBF2 domain-containing protein n=1 Tax=Cylindrotheca closterium TaxID=2856 RepID=A0AAD2CAA3_9STRA|nr:unnamed protein product [Cylindrotheca closterium]
MFRRFIERTTNRQASDGDGESLTHQNSSQNKSFQAKELSSFVAGIEACDNLASTSTSSGRVEAKTGLSDCSVLVSADGDLLIIPRELAKDKPMKNERTKSFLDQTSSDFGEEYQSAIFMGNDLNADGDKQLNGFTSKGWSVPATTLAVKQSADSMNDFCEFSQHLTKAKKISAAQEGFLAKRLKALTDITSESNKARSEEYKSMLDDAFPEHTVQLLPQRVGPLAFQEGSVHTTLNSLANYYSHVAQSETNRWKAAAEATGALGMFAKAKEQTVQRELNRRIALKQMIQKKKSLEEHLAACKEDSIKRWNEVHDAEEKVTHLLEEKIMERNRQKEQKRMERLKEDEKKRRQDAAVNGSMGTTQSEIWDIVSAVTANMEEGSFEPMDFAPTDQSHASGDGTMSESIVSEDDTVASSLPIVDRHDLEQEQALPELRVAALTADEAVEDAAHALLTFLSEWDVTVRSSKLAAETCLIGACNAQAKCLRTIIDMERKAMEERMEQLEHLEAVAFYMDVRADLDNYIKLDKTESGGYSVLGDEDDGGVAAAFTVLDDHVNGNLGMDFGADAYHDSMTAEDMENMLSAPDNMEEMMDIFFKNDSGMGSDPSEESEAMDEFEKSVALLCKLGQDKTSAGRVHRSTICYALNAKRNNEDEVPTMVQFEGLCRLFSAVLSGCNAKTASSVKILMTLSQIFFIKDADGKEVLVKSKLINHPLWSDDELWDNVLYQDVTENLSNSGLMENFDHHSERTKVRTYKKKGEWTENTKLKWHDLRDSDRYDAASQVHAIVFAQLGTLAHTMIEFGCGLHRSCAFVRRMAVRNQLPISQRTMLLQHLMGTEKEGAATK